MPHPDWKQPRQYDRLAILFGAGAGHSHQIEDPLLRLPLGNELMHALLREAFPGDNPEQQFRDNIYKDTAVQQPDLTADFVWEALMHPPEAGVVADMPPRRSRRQLPVYFQRLCELYGVNRPIPKAYNILAELLFSCPNLECMATTCFDEVIDAAVNRAAQIRERIPLRDFRIASIPSQYEFLHREDFDGPVLYKLNGTLSDPYSIVGGTSDVDPWRKEQVIDPFLAALDRATHVIIIGYSFRDPLISTSVADTIRHSASKQVFVVAGDDTNDLVNRLSDGCNPAVKIHAADDLLAENFLDRFWQDMPPPALALRRREVQVLREGPKSLPVANPDRFLSQSARSGGNGQLLFHDPIYGKIALPGTYRAVLAKLIDLGEIQRLRRIQQLSFVQYRYPSATHTRFAHSLGVAHLVNRMIELQNGHKGGKFLHSVPSALVSGADRELLAAALLHDAGHGPSGHTLDSLKEFMPVAQGRQGHERAAQRLLIDALKSDGFADLKALLGEEGLPVEKLAAIIVGTHPLSPIISNGGLDLDRLDFILRDLLHAGLPIGGTSAREYVNDMLADLDGLLLAFRLIPADRLAPKSAPWYFQLSRADKDRGNCKVYRTLERLGTAYGCLYDQVYHCWQNSCAQAMITKALDRVLASRRFHLLDILPQVDEQLLETLQTFDDPIVAQLASLVKYRRLYDPVFKVRLKRPIKVYDARPIEKMLNEAYAGRGMVNFLVAFRPYKEFTASFKDSDFFPKGKISVRTKPFGRPAPARLHVFVWPGLDFDPRLLKQQLTRALESEQFGPTDYLISNPPFD